MLEVIIFDLGGVLVPEKWDFILSKISEVMSVSPDRFSELMRPYESDTREGKIGLLDTYSCIVGELGYGDPQRLVDMHMELYKEHQSEIDGRVLDLINKLKENYRVVSFTNTEREIAEYNKQRGLFDTFEKNYISCDMNCKKPGGEIHKKMLDDLGVPAENTLFIDNDPSYINGAERVGIPCILFTGYEQLVEELGNRGVEF